MAREQPTVTVIIPAKNAARLLPRALASIANQSYRDIIEVVVAAADDESALAAKDAVVVDNPSGSTPAGLNLAWRHASGQVIVRCDAQSVLPAEYVEVVVATLTSTGAANVGGMQVPVGSTEWEKAIAAAMRSRLGSGGARYRTGGSGGPVETVYLGSFWKDKLAEVGGFDERFLRTQDYELNHRLIESGGTVWLEPRLRVEYRPRGSLKDLWAQYFAYGRAKRLMSKVHPGSLRSRQIAPVALVVTLCATLAGSIVWPWLLVVPAAYAASLTVAGLRTTASGGPLRVASAIGTMHIAWGLGFLTGPG